MSKRQEMSNRRPATKKAPDTERTDPFRFSLGLLLEVYLFLLIGIYPFLIKAGYGETSHVKYGFLVGISYGLKVGPAPFPAFVPIAVVLAVAHICFRVNNEKMPVTALLRREKMSATDKAVLVYSASLIVSSVISPYKEELLWGYPGWNMGVLSQVLFVFLYFVVSRFFDPDDLRFFTGVALLASSIVFVIAILQRFGADVLNLYAGVTEKKLFLSTIGQASWFSSYMILFVAAGVFVVCYAERSDRSYKAGVGFLVIASICLVTQNTDSAYAGLFLMLSFLLVWSFDSFMKLRRIIEVSLIILLGFRAAGIARRLAGDHAVTPDRLSVFFMDHPFVYVMIGVLIFFYLTVRRMQKDKNTPDTGRYTVLGRIYAGVLVLSIALLLLYIVMNSTGRLPESISSSNNYLRFNRDWGNRRGAVLHDTVLSFLALMKEKPLQGIFGAGADQFYHVIQAYVSDWSASFTSKILTNAHNEWLTAYVNFGLIGGTAYLGIFVSAIIRAVRNRQTVPCAMGCAACVVAYMAHNLFCYQQYICTPYIFVIMGINECLLRSPALKSLNGL